MEGIQIHPISGKMYRDLGQLVGWEETRLRAGEAVEAHQHSFNAMYFTTGVNELYSEGQKISLPERAAVFIQEGTEHAWSGVRNGHESAVVGHFHSGHGIHKVVNQYL